ncbi:MAG: hypothetical protein ACRENP_06270 [Longimicrobiales bacterium]
MQRLLPDALRANYLITPVGSALVVFRQELLEGVRAMRGARLADLFSGA